MLEIGIITNKGCKHIFLFICYEIIELCKKQRTLLSFPYECHTNILHNTYNIIDEYECHRYSHLIFQ